MPVAAKDPNPPKFLKFFRALMTLSQQAKVTYPLDEVFLLVLCAVIEVVLVFRPLCSPIRAVPAFIESKGIHSGLFF